MKKISIIAAAILLVSGLFMACTETKQAGTMVTIAAVSTKVVGERSYDVGSFVATPAPQALTFSLPAGMADGSATFTVPFSTGTNAIYVARNPLETQYKATYNGRALTADLWTACAGPISNASILAQTGVRTGMTVYAYCSYMIKPFFLTGVYYRVNDWLFTNSYSGSTPGGNMNFITTNGLIPPTWELRSTDESPGLFFTNGTGNSVGLYVNTIGDSDPGATGWVNAVREIPITNIVGTNIFTFAATSTVFATDLKSGFIIKSGNQPVPFRVKIDGMSRQ